MSHLIEEYAKSCGVFIGEPIIKEHYYPIMHEKYITIHSDAKDQARSYDHWDIVTQLLKKPLSEKNIKIIQIGGKDAKSLNFIDQKITGCTYKNTFYIIKKSLLHLGINSLPVHVASHYKKKIVNIFGNLYPECAHPYWSEKSDVINLHPDFSKIKPSFSINEKEKRINEIKPEDIVNSVLKLLDLDENVNFKSIYFGPDYNKKFFEIVPNNSKTVSDERVNIRMDKHYDLKQMLFITKHNKCEITTKKPIPKEYIFKKNIISINYISSNFDNSFIKEVKKMGIKISLLCDNEKKLKKERLRFFHENIFSYQNKDLTSNVSKIIETIDWDKLKVFSCRKILHKDKIYSSYYEITGKKEDLLLDLRWIMMYYDSHE